MTLSLKYTPVFLALLTALSISSCDKKAATSTNNTNTDTASATPETSLSTQAQKAQVKPNIIIFYVDDLGYGDLSSYGAKGVQTPNIDELAKEGIKFTDAHSSAATCTPSRYSLLTGEYAFRNNAAILPGDAPLIIDPEKHTLPRMLKSTGYETAVVGKWHLGLGMGEVDWNQDVKPGPLELGFDYSFLMPATGDRVPTVYLENRKVVGLTSDDPLHIDYQKKIGVRPTGSEHPELLKVKADPQHSKTIINGISRIGYMAGGKSAEWVDEEFPFVFTDKAIEFIRNHQTKPFFLYFPFHDIHVPRTPNEMFIDKSTMGPRGDAIVQTDWMTGKIIEELKALDIYDNTLIIFTSDNGPVLDDGYDDKAVERVGDHDPSGGFRGGKYSAYEAGTRVPMIVTYPQGLQSAGESTALISHIDFYRSLAGLLNLELDKHVAIDSQNLMNTLLNAQQKGRNFILEESFTLSLRDHQWKYIEPFAGKTPAWLANKDIEVGLTSEPQLFDLEKDPGETTNLAKTHANIVTKMQSRINEIKLQSSHQ